MLPMAVGAVLGASLASMYFLDARKRWEVRARSRGYIAGMNRGRDIARDLWSNVVVRGEEGR